MTNNGICAQYGTPSDTGVIFCKNCGATLRPGVSLIQPIAQGGVPNRIDKRISAKGVLLIFLLCALSDFAWGYFKARSLPAGVISVVLGVFGTTFYAWLMGVFRTSKSE